MVVSMVLVVIAYLEPMVLIVLLHVTVTWEPVWMVLLVMVLVSVSLMPMDPLVYRVSVLMVLVMMVIPAMVLVTVFPIPTDLPVCPVPAILKLLVRRVSLEMVIVQSVPEINGVPIVWDFVLVRMDNAWMILLELDCVVVVSLIFMGLIVTIRVYVRMVLLNVKMILMGMVPVQSWIGVFKRNQIVFLLLLEEAWLGLF